jgi:hypothetical protein
MKLTNKLLRPFFFHNTPQHFAFFARQRKNIAAMKSPPSELKTIFKRTGWRCVASELSGEVNGTTGKS